VTIHGNPPGDTSIDKQLDFERGRNLLGKILAALCSPKHFASKNAARLKGALNRNGTPKDQTHPLLDWRPFLVMTPGNLVEVCNAVVVLGRVGQHSHWQNLQEPPAVRTSNPMRR
jgi:hypothetical protein